MSRRKLLVPIVNRTNFTKLKPVLLRLLEEPVDLQIVASSGILVNRIGSGADDVIKLFKKVLRIDCLLMNDTHEAMAKTIGLSTTEHASLFAKERPDALLVVGDRFDMLGPVIAARVMNVPVLHMQGGERSGSIDDYVRDFISLSSERHYVATETARRNVMTLTSSQSVFNFGCPAVEYVASLHVGDALDVRTFHKSFKHGLNIAPGEDYIAVLVHPDTTKDDVNMSVVLDAVLSFPTKCILFYPNIDAYNSKITSCINTVKTEKNVFCIKHMPVEDFVKVMAHARCLVGNSSSGIREAASFGTPVVNIGSRQKGRERNANTIDASCRFDVLKDAIDMSLKVRKYPKDNVYWQPNSAERICHDVVGFLEGT